MSLLRRYSCQSGIRFPEGSIQSFKCLGLLLMLLACGKGCTPPGAQGHCWTGECVPGGQEKALGKADLWLSSWRSSLMRSETSVGTLKRILRLLPMSELSWVCSDVELVTYPLFWSAWDIELCEKELEVGIFIIIVGIYTVLIDKLGGTEKKPCCIGEWRSPVWSLNTFWPRSSKKTVVWEELKW